MYEEDDILDITDQEIDDFLASEEFAELDEGISMMSLKPGKSLVAKATSKNKPYTYSKGDKLSVVQSGDLVKLKKGGKYMMVPLSDVQRDFELKEDHDLEEAVLTVQQRIKRGRMMKRMAPRIKRARAIKKKRFANKETLTKRARKAAIGVIRKKFAGKLGANYNKLTTTQKISVDKAIEKKRGSIDRIARRLFPKVREKEMARLKSVRSSHKESIDNNFLSYISEDYKNIDYLFEQFFPDDKIIESLYEKSIKSNIDYSIIREVYNRALGASLDSKYEPSEYAFNAVNSYISEGAALDKYEIKEQDLSLIKKKHQREKESLKARHERERDRTKIRKIRTEDIEESALQDMFPGVIYALKRITKSKEFKAAIMDFMRGKKAATQMSDGAVAMKVAQKYKGIEPQELIKFIRSTKLKTTLG